MAMSRLLLVHIAFLLGAVPADASPALAVIPAEAAAGNALPTKMTIDPSGSTGDMPMLRMTNASKSVDVEKDTRGNLMRRQSAEPKAASVEVSGAAPPNPNPLYVSAPLSPNLAQNPHGPPLPPGFAIVTTSTAAPNVPSNQNASWDVLYYGIQSMKTKEFMYAGASRLASERIALTWGRRSTPELSTGMRWEFKDFYIANYSQDLHARGHHFYGIQMVGDKKWLCTKSPHEEAVNRHVVVCEDSGDPMTVPEMRWKVIAYHRRGETFYGIKSDKHNEWLYTATPKLSTYQRRVLTSISHAGTPESSPDMRWVIAAY